MLEDIKNCNLCVLRKTCRGVVLGSGKDKSVFIVGEAPGKTEDEVGKPFVGDSGKLVRAVVDDNYYITNVVKCRPPNNITPTNEQIDICVQNNFKREFETYKPKKLILLGKSAQKLLNYDFIKDVEIITFYHPSYYIRNGKGEDWKLEFEKIISTKGTRRVNLKNWFE